MTKLAEITEIEGRGEDECGDGGTAGLAMNSLPGFFACGCSSLRRRRRPRSLSTLGTEGECLVGWLNLQFVCFFSSNSI